MKKVTWYRLYISLGDSGSIEDWSPASTWNSYEAPHGSRLSVILLLFFTAFNCLSLGVIVFAYMQN